MNRNEEFSAGSGKRPLYHGTSQDLKPGSIIYPGTHSSHPENKDYRYYRDSDSEYELNNYLNNRDEDDDRTDDEVREDWSEYGSHHYDSAWATPDLENAKGYADRGKGHVYQVEHLSPESCDGCNHPNNPSMDDHTDSAGFRVVKAIQ